MDWLSEFRQAAPENAVVMLVGNKMDLVEVNPASRCTDQKMIQSMAQVNKLLYVETSAAVGKNVTEAFHRLLQGRRR